MHRSRFNSTQCTLRVSQYCELGRLERCRQPQAPGKGSWCHTSEVLFGFQCTDTWKVIISADDSDKTFLDKIIGNDDYSVLLTWHPDRHYHIFTKLIEIRKSSQKAYSN